jgi:choline monooxygenase
MADLTRAETLDAALYHTAEAFERERRSIFAREWILVGHESELAEPGQTLAECLAGYPIFVRRGRDGSLRGFHNVCRHRAGPLADDGASSLTLLRCRYHGWTYEEDGRLKSARDFGDAEEFDPAQFSLFPIRIACARGFVFVNFDENAAPLETALGPFLQVAKDVPFEETRFFRRVQHEIGCNWKTYAENYLEGYHIPFLHPALSREVEARDYRVEPGPGYVLHHVPSRSNVEAPVYSGFWAWVAPNVAFNVYGNGMSVERMLPTGPRSMRIEYLFFFNDVSDDGREARDAALSMCEQVTAEDRAICEAVQRNLEAGIYVRGRLSPRHEAGVHAFQERVRAAIA